MAMADGDGCWLMAMAVDDAPFNASTSQRINASTFDLRPLTFDLRPFTFDLIPSSP